MSSVVPDPPDDSLSGEESSHQEHPQDPEETRLSFSGMLQMPINAILATLYLVIALAFRFATRSIPDPLDDNPPHSSEEPSHTEHPQDLGETHLSEMRQVTITSICATDLTLSLRRIPAGFHVTVQADGAECKTSNKVVLNPVFSAGIEKDSRPSEPSSKVRVSVYASFELDPMLGPGELLRTFEISVGELLDRSAKSHPIVFQPKAGEVISSCTSLFMTVEQRRSDDNDATVLRPVTTLMTSDMNTLALKTDAGHRLLARYRRTQNSRDLEQSIKHFERASDLCPVDHPCHPAALSNLATAKFISCQANGTHLDLDIPISLFQDALDLRPTGHPDRPFTQLHLAIALLSRFAKRGSQTDADMAEELLIEVLDVCYANSHVFRAALLAIETSALHQAGSIDVDNTGQEQLAESMLPWSPDELGQRLDLCLQRDVPAALDAVISFHHHALEYYSGTHSRRGQVLGQLGIALLTRFERRGNGQDLDNAITHLREELGLYPVGHPYRGGSLNNLGGGLFTRFEQRGNDQDLDEAITLNMEALAFHPVGDPQRPVPLNNLASQLCARFRRRGNSQDLDKAIALHREALALHPVGHSDRPISLHNLGTELFVRFEQRGNDRDLDEAIALYREALALYLVGHPHRSKSLDNLAAALSTCFEHRGNDQYLDEAIALHREALALHPVGHSGRSMSLSNLASRLSTCFKHRGNDQDLDEATVLHREVLALRPVGHPFRSVPLNNLASALFTSFECRGSDQDLDEAIPLYREALALRPLGHPDRSSSLNNLACGLSTRFERQGNVHDLDETILLHREALALRPLGHPYRSMSLNNLANQLSTRFKHRGNAQDLDEAITLIREALTLRPLGHPHRSQSLDILANGLTTRFQQRGNDQDLDEAIALYREALDLYLVGHPYRSSPLSNLANGLSTRFVHRGNDEDLDEAITLLREALTLRPLGHPHRSVSLNILGNQLSARLKHRGNDQDLDDAIVLHGEALALCPVGHPDRSSSLNNLANSLFTRFEHRGNVQDLNGSLEHNRCALTLLTQHDPRQLEVHLSLAAVYLLVHQSGLDGTSEDADSLNAAMHHFKAAANVVSGGLLRRLRASLDWVRYADGHTHGTELEAYATSMQLLDAYMSATASVSSRHDIMKVFPPGLAVKAASCALRRNDVRRAVELLEQGRTLIWTQMARVRTPLDSLQERGDHAQALMKKFRDLSFLLDKPPAEHREGIPRVDIEAAAVRYTRLVADWNQTAEEIRELEGFSHFLLPPLFSELQDAACDGPIIVLLASKASCDAIIILHTQPPVSVRLAINLEHLVRLSKALSQTVDKEAGPRGTQPGLIKVLRELWDDIVRPVVENLDRFARRGSRIWWCPTTFFNFLPLHAAGEYKRGGKSLSQLYVSSYTPSLTAMIRARKSNDGSLSQVSFVAIGQNHPPGHSLPLEAVEPELELVRSLLPPPPTVFFTKVTSVESTKSTVLRTLQGNRWLHFACHGTQNFAEPFKSAFLMRDQPLSLLDITQTNLSRHEFAFLSACETAVGNFETPDEVIHLAAGLQFSGVKSVVGTLWSVNDATVRRLVEAFYKNFCGDGTMDSKRAARALHRAVQSLASDKDIPLDQRIVFVHIGL
ncbi:CHAT domain-containing protein [Suillus paluster]|uniref:CHAT domain-containing protein n=1 Tax=Suillus paluster TaxID=48578 RepID=UPI001B8688CC|nr:CHAT domain-containing protein [Suillus paluster]KAG1732626.1 CHAT domain-containing protein [Suillus paluster]